MFFRTFLAALAFALTACGGAARPGADAAQGAAQGAAEGPVSTGFDSTDFVSTDMDGDAIEAPRFVPTSMEEARASFAPVVERAAPAVVNVFTRGQARRSTGDAFFDRFFGVGPRETTSLGSGVIVSPDGVVVTNNHVIENMSEIKVVFADRREFGAELVLADPRTDLAVLKIEAGEPLPFLEFANSDAAEVGDLVLAIGNPFGVGQTVTSGIVSALARTAVTASDDASYQFFIQTDAAINPGNSGGALVDVDGRLLGVNTAIYSRSGGSNGIGFAVPSRLVRQVIATALRGGEIQRPWSGASTETVNASLAKALGLDRPAGAIVNDL
ncbi:MAG: trypsin-like peptidase domain-containing protein [Parvularculaceae bacterium]